MDISSTTSLSSVSLVAPAASGAHSRPRENDTVRAVVEAAFNSISTPVYHGAENIDRLDQDGNFLRYFFPNLSLADYMGSVSEIRKLYRGVAAGLFSYEKVVGCYATIVLEKSREQSEDDYEGIIHEFQCERHALHTIIKKDWVVVLERAIDPEVYAQKSLKRRERQLAGMQKVVDAWKKTGLFKDVFVPNDKYRIETLQHCPENVACIDEIFLVYKTAPPEERASGSLPQVIEVDPPIAEAQREARIYYDNMNRSLPRKMWDSIPPILCRRPSFNHTADLESRIIIEDEASLDEIEKTRDTSMDC